MPKIDLFEALQRDIGGLNRIFLLEDVQNKMEDHKRYLEVRYFKRSFLILLIDYEVRTRKQSGHRQDCKLR